MTSARPRFPWLLSLLSLVLLVILIALGVWQVQRLAWKEGLIASAEAAKGAPVRPLAEVLALPDPEFRSVLATCPGLARAPFVELQTIEAKQMAVRLVSVCHEATSGTILLVDRGVLLAEVSQRPEVTPGDTMPVVVSGVLRRVTKPGRMTPAPEGHHFYGRDTKAMAKVLGETGLVSDFTLFATQSANPELPALQPSVPPVAFANNHLGYALTWFGLAIALIVFYAVLLRRRLSLKES